MVDNVSILLTLLFHPPPRGGVQGYQTGLPFCTTETSTLLQHLRWACRARGTEKVGRLTARAETAQQTKGYLYFLRQAHLRCGHACGERIAHGPRKKLVSLLPAPEFCCKNTVGFVPILSGAFPFFPRWATKNHNSYRPRRNHAADGISLLFCGGVLENRA